MSGSLLRLFRCCFLTADCTNCSCCSLFASVRHIWRQEVESRWWNDIAIMLTSPISIWPRLSKPRSTLGFPFSLNGWKTNEVDGVSNKKTKKAGLEIAQLSCGETPDKILYCSLVTESASHCTTKWNSSWNLEFHRQKTTRKEPDIDKKIHRTSAANFYHSAKQIQRKFDRVRKSRSLAGLFSRTSLNLPATWRLSPLLPWLYLTDSLSSNQVFVGCVLCRERP